MGKENPFIKMPFPEFKNVGKLNEKEAGEVIEQLREAIEHHNHLYYVKNQPEISDSSYDKLFHRLEKLEQEFPELDSELSPTKKVGAPPLDELKKISHQSVMLSLNSSSEKSEIREFLKRVKKLTGIEKPDFVLEPKLDGLSAEIVYRDGAFEYGATRGDGETGEDISANIKTIRSVPMKLRKKEDVPSFLSIRGEIIMSLDGFSKVNKQRIENGKDPFANPRNAVAGIMRQLDPSKAARYPVDIFFYEILESNEQPFVSHWEMLNTFPEWGLKVSELKWKASSFEDIEKYHDELARKRDSMEYEIDGMVIKLDDRKAREKAGTRQRSPRWAFAWKFPPRKKVTTLKEIIIQVGRTGILTPVALLDPVETGGVTISRASLHNEDEVNRKNAAPGDKVKVIRAGDVIPKVAEVVEKKSKKKEKFKMPVKCPVCGTKVVKEGAYTVCPAGLSCKAQLTGRIIHFASRQAMNIEHMGDETVRQLVDSKMIASLPDLYELKKEDLLQLEGFAEKSAEKLYNAIQKSKKPRLSNFIYALGIRQVGEHMARVLVRHFGSLDKLKNTGREEMESIDEVGPETARSIHHFFSSEENRKMLGRLEEVGLEPQKTAEQASLPLKGLTIVVTGELESYTRSEIKDEIEKLGGHASSSVSGNTDYVVAGENPGSKLDEAQKRDVKIIDEKEYRKLARK